MLAQLKTVELIKEAIKLAFFRLVGLQAQNGQKQSTSSETWQSILVLRNEGCSMREIADLVQRCVLLPSQNSANCL
jgi:hypothetical protein